MRHIHNSAALHSHGLNQRNAKKKPWAQWRAGAGRTIQMAAGAGAAAASCARNSQLRSVLHDLSPRHFQNISTISTHFHATIISRTALPLLSRPWRTSHLPSPSTSSPPGNSKHQKGRLAGRLATPTPTLHTRLVSSLLTPKPPSTASKTSP